MNTILKVFDNDAIHNFKSTKSSVFSNRIATETEKEDQLLQQQNSTISSLQKSLKIKLNNFRKLISFKNRKRKRQFRI